MPKKSVNLCATDPPYKLVSGGCKSSLGGIFAPDVYDNDGSLFATLPFADWIPLVWDVLASDADFYVIVNDKNVQECLNVATDTGFQLHNILVWDKGNVTPNRWYMKGCEFILYFWKGKARPINNKGSSQMIRIPNVRNRIHPTEKPVELFRVFIGNSCNPGDVVLDPFMGSGSSGVAALLTECSYIGIEYDNGYYTDAKKRIEIAESVRQLPLL